MKRIISVCLCIIMLFSLVACGVDGGQDVTTTSTTASSTTVTTPIGASTDKLEYSDWDKDGYHIYVSNDGFDGNDGKTPETSVQSVYKANELAADYINGTEHNKKDVIISFASGNYYLPKAVNIVSGTDDIAVYLTSRGGRAYFTGGLNIKPYEIHKCEDAKILDRIFDQTARENIYEVNLSYYSDYLTTLEPIRNLRNDYGTYIYDTIEFYVGDYNLQPSRFPEEGYQVSDNTAAGIEMPGAFAVTYLNYMKDGKFVSIADIGGEFSTTPINIFISGETYERVKSWDLSDQKVYMEDTLQNNYTVTRHHITSFTDEAHTFGDVSYDGYVTLNTGRSGNGAVGVPSNGGSASEFRRAYFFNIIEEINAPGEFYYDEAGKKLYVYLDETMPTDDLYVATTTDHLFELIGAEDNLTQNIHFVNIGMKYSQTHLVRIQNADNISMKGCVIGYNAGLAVFTHNATNLTFRDSLFESTGGGTFYFCYAAWGDNDGDGKFDLANILVENCVIRDISEQRVDYASAFRIQGLSGVTVRRCTVSDGGHAAASIDWDHGANLLFEYNEWFDFMTETDDGGLFYAGTQDVTTMTGIVWRYNLIHDIGSTWQPWSVRVFYADGNSMLHAIHDNIIYNFQSGTGGGHVFHNVHGATIYNNIIMNISSCASILTEYPYLDQHADLMRSLRSDTKCDNGSEGKYYVLFEGASGEDGKGYTDARRALYESGDLDPEFGYSFERMNYLRSDEFLYEMFSKGYAVMTGQSASAMEQSVRNGGTIAIDDTTISDFKVVLSKNVNGNASGNYTFASVDEMTEFLLSLGYNGDYDTANLPSGVSIRYKDKKVLKFYFNLLSADSPKDNANWILSDIAMERAKTDKYISTDIDTLFTPERGYSHYVYQSAILSKVAWTGKYYNNITVNVKKDLSAPLAKNEDMYWDSLFTLSYDNWDFDGAEFDIINENREFTLEFLDYIVNDDGELYFDIFDLSRVGASLDVNG